MKKIIKTTCLFFIVLQLLFISSCVLENNSGNNNKIFGDKFYQTDLKNFTIEVATTSVIGTYESKSSVKVLFFVENDIEQFRFIYSNYVNGELSEMFTREGFKDEDGTVHLEEESSLSSYKKLCSKYLLGIDELFLILYNKGDSGFEYNEEDGMYYLLDTNIEVENDNGAFDDIKTLKVLFTDNQFEKMIVEGDIHTVEITLSDVNNTSINEGTSSILG